MSQSLSLSSPYPSAVTIGMQKGGVGKSFLTVNTAIFLAQAGHKVLIIDLDPEACATNLLLAEDISYETLGTVLEVYNGDCVTFADVIVKTRYAGLDLVACKAKARRVNKLVSGSNPKKLLTAKMAGLEHYDAIFFEIPPTFSDIISSAYLTSRLIIFPTFPDVWSLESISLSMEDIQEECQKFDVDVPEFKILLNKYLAKRSASKETLEVLKQDYNEYLLPFYVKDSADVQNSLNEGKSIFEGHYSAEVRDSIQQLATYILPQKHQKERS